LRISSEPWGTVDGKAVELYTLSNGDRMSVRIANYGGVVQSIWVPDSSGILANVALGFSRLSDYVNDFTNQPWPATGGSGDTYFGAIIGRYANRIADASFTLSGVTYTLPANNGPNTLHGGPDSWNTKVWSAASVTGPGSVALKLAYTDPDGYNGFPGTVSAEVTYTLTMDNALKIEYGASTDKATIINVTSHMYFNLAGEGSGDVMNQLLRINADRFAPVGQNLIPTGTFAPVAGTPFDFRTPKPIGREIRRTDMTDGDQLAIAHGYDHNWVLNDSGFRLAAVAQDPRSGRIVEICTDQPAVQFYSGNLLVGDLVGSSGHGYRQGDGFALETQHSPDTPHHIGDPDWPSVVLNPGQAFTSTTIYRFSTGRLRGQ
jgi:aldose 1-epimerase